MSVNLTDGPIARNIALFTIPLLLSNLLQQLYNSIDAMVLGRFAGPVALAAVGSTGALINLLIGFFLGISTGTVVLYAMHYGAGDTKGLKKLVDSAIFLSLVAAVVISVAGILSADRLLHLMNTPEEAFAPSREYLVIYLSGTVAMMVYNVGAGMIRAEGDSVRPLLYLAIGGVGNLALDLFMVAVLKMGIRGAAFATVFAMCITAVLVCIRLCRLPEEYRLRPLSVRPVKLTVWDITRISIPCGLSSSMFNIANLLVQAKINSFGAVAMAGTTAYGKIDAFVYMPMTALSLSVSTYVGQNVGAGKYDRIRKGIRASIVMGLVCSIVLCAVVFFAFDPIIRLFTEDEEAIAIGREMMLFLIPFVWFYSIGDILGGAIRGAGHAVAVTVIYAVTICVLRIVWLEGMLRISNDIRIVYLCYPISWWVATFVFLWYYYRLNFKGKMSPA